MTFCSIYLLLLSFSAVNPVIAGPLERRQSNPGDGPNGFQPVIYVPIVVVVIILIAIAVGGGLRRRRSTRSTQGTTNTNGIVQVSANQLLGRNSNNNNNNNATSSQPRRARRNRRRASQLSVTSLPLYMEEAGDTELVLVRGNREIIDPMPRDQEHSQQHDEEIDGPREGSENDSSHAPASARRSYDSADSLREERERVTSPLMENHRENADHSQNSPSSSVPSEDAPPYTESAIDTPATQFREVNLNDGPTVPQEQPTSTQTQSVSENENETNDRTMTGNTNTRRFPLRPMPNLRNFFTRTPSEGNETNIANAGNRALTPSSSRQHLLSHQRSTSTFSSSSSTLHLTPSTSRLSIRPFDRGMNASQISLTSISAPLQHTLTKTEFNYPKNGPTPEQMKFLGSRESLALFGVPFGSAALAYSRVEPPPFESSGSGSGEHAEASGSNAEVNTNREQPGHNQEAEDYMVVPSSSGAERSIDESLHEGPSSAKEAEGFLVRKDSLANRPGTALDTETTGFETARSMGDPTGEVHSSSSTTKITIPVMIIREPSPGPPTPPPTPPRQTLNTTEDEARAVVGVTASASS